MAHNSLKDMLNYRFDNFMSRGGSSIFISLTVVFFALLLVIFGLRIALYELMPEAASQHSRDVLRNLYIVFLEMTDPGNMAQDIESSPWFKLTAILSGMAGIVLLSALIAFITTALDRKLNELKKGHSKVIEAGHTLILGWDDRRILEILRELVEANESEKRPCVVILADRDKEQMDDFLKLFGGDFRNTRVITRSGKPSSLTNLDVVSVKHCKCCIVLAECGENAALKVKQASDAQCVKTVLAIHTACSGRSGLNVVAEIFRPENRRIAEEVMPGGVTVINAQSILAKIMVQTSRSVGLSVVYNEVLSFEGCELYLYQSDWSGISFGELGYHFDDGVPMGLLHENQKITLNPPANLALKPSDKVLILAEDNDTIKFDLNLKRDIHPLPLANRCQKKSKEQELIIGWGSKLPLLVREYADYVEEGSVIDILPRETKREAIQKRVALLQKQVPNIRLNVLDENVKSLKDLAAIDPSRYDNIIILSPSEQGGNEESYDAESISEMLLLRSVFQRGNGLDGNTKLITEVLSSENAELVAKTGVHDFIISNRFVSMLLAQVSENRFINSVYEDLFSEDGSEIYLKPLSLYLDDIPESVSFADLMALVFLRSETCLGVKIKALEKDGTQNFGVELNPAKDKRFNLCAEDCLVVLAEDET